ncbi:MAG TPA: protein lplB [Clostridiaceae bacterium]|nr:protein lplB [Clostridiaceae bacterium]
MMKKSSISYHIMMMPAIILLAIFAIYPMIGSIIAFENYNPVKGMWHSQFVGLENFKYMFQIPEIKQVLYNTVSIAVMKIIFTEGSALIFALLLNELKNRFFKRTIQTIVYLPHFISWVLLGGIVANIFSLDGIVNHIIGMFGVKPIMFLGSNSWFPGILVGTSVWQEFGFGAIIYLAALTGIDPSLYEAASIDGASRFKQIISITLPGISTTIVLMMMLNLQNILNAGSEQVLNLYNPMVYKSGDIIDTYVYRAGLKELQYELATAVGLLKSVVSFIMVVLSYFLADKFANYRIF